MSNRDKLDTVALCSLMFASVLAIVSACLVFIGWIASARVGQAYHFVNGMLAIVTSMAYAVTSAFKTGQTKFAATSSPTFPVLMSLCWFITGTLLLVSAAFGSAI